MNEYTRWIALRLHLTPSVFTLIQLCLRTQEPDRTTSLAPAETEVCAGAVLPNSGGAEHQASGAAPQPTANTHWGSQHLAEVSEDTRQRRYSQPGTEPLNPFFNTHAWVASTMTAVPILPPWERYQIASRSIGAADALQVPLVCLAAFENHFCGHK